VSLGRWTQVSAIQLPYNSGFSGLCEYANAMARDEVDFGSVVRGRCPLCGGGGCIRQLTAYSRWAIELFPPSKMSVPVARFECVRLRKKDGKRHTFSLLPLELAPYHRYTLRSMLMALVLFSTLMRGQGWTVEETVLAVVPLDSPVTVSLLRYWAKVAVRGLRRAHSLLVKAYPALSQVASGSGFGGEGREVETYLRSCRVRAPPHLDTVSVSLTEPADGWHDDVAGVVQAYRRSTSGFLVGTPSQDRG